MASTTEPKRRRESAFTLLEAMLLVVILGVVFLGFGIGLQSSARVPGAVNRRLAIHSRLVEKMEDLASLDFTTLKANSGLSDTVTIGNTSYTRTVAVSTVDADGVGGVDADFIEVSVTISGQSLKTRVAQP